MALLCTHRAFALSNPCLKSTTSVNPSSLPHYHRDTSLPPWPQNLKFPTSTVPFLRRCRTTRHYQPSLNHPSLPHFLKLITKSMHCQGVLPPSSSPLQPEQKKKDKERESGKQQEGDTGEQRDEVYGRRKPSHEPPLPVVHLLMPPRLSLP
ncbi:hypothetical protein M0R45_025883 [Rubus argutus]|uniref:Uncharacterized protein n=1 Tax=Rubus argutus TaxID=59490 RepID=A0AAW1WVU8_RUBAR